MSRRSNSSGPTCFSRQADDFPAYPLPDMPVDILEKWLAGLHIHPLSAMEWQCKESWFLPARTLPDSTWWYCHKGAGYFQIDDNEKHYPFRSGDLFILGQGKKHTIHQNPGQSLKVATIHFHARLFNVVNLFEVFEFSPLQKGERGCPFKDASERLCRLFAHKPPGWISAMKIEITRVLYYLIYSQASRLEIRQKQNSFSTFTRLHPALQWIDDHLYNPRISINLLARHIHVSEVYLRKLFQRSLGMSPSAYIQRQRVDQACTWLRSSEMSIQEIAHKSGFSDTPYFYRVFRKRTGTTPVLYRNIQTL